LIGALLALLDYNQLLKKLNGRLFPLGFLRLLTGRRHITAVRAMAMTMVPGYQSSGLGIVFLDNLVHVAARRGIERYEFSWVLESNDRSRGTLSGLGQRSPEHIASTTKRFEPVLDDCRFLPPGIAAEVFLYLVNRGAGCWEPPPPLHTLPHMDGRTDTAGGQCHRLHGA